MCSSCVSSIEVVGYVAVDCCAVLGAFCVSASACLLWARRGAGPEQAPGPKTEGGVWGVRELPRLAHDGLME